MERAAAYLRRSVADEGNPGDVSRAVQEQGVRDLARRYGFNGGDPITWHVDWARSASEEKASRRTEYARMLRTVEAGEVTHLLAYSMDRLNRSVAMTAALVKACEAHDVRIVTVREGEVRHDSPSEWLRWTNLATFAEFELRTITDRNRATALRRRERGDAFAAAYGTRLVRRDGVVVAVPDPSRPIDPVLDAVRATRGNIVEACRRLEDRGVPAPKGRTRWSPSSLAYIVDQQAPHLRQRHRPRGRRTPNPSPLAGLVRCPHCDHVLSPQGKRGGLWCRMALKDRDGHPRYWTSEARVMTFVREQVDRRRRVRITRTDLTAAVVEERRRVEAVLEALDARLEVGRISAADYKRRVREAKERLAEAARTEDEWSGFTGKEPLVDWDADPSTVNAQLHRVVDAVGLDADMRPAKVVWRQIPVPARRKAS